MIYISERGLKIIMLVFLLVIFIFIIYFINETKKIENVYDDLLFEANLNLD